MRKYGLPYKGGKWKLADSIVRLLPSAETLWDIFCGGGSISDRARETGKFKRIHLNDIQNGQAECVRSLFDGTLEVPMRWISHEEFFELRLTNPIIRMVWSFGNDGHSYLFSREIEPWKKAYFYARELNDYSLLEEIGITQRPISRKWIHDHHKECREKYLAWVKPYLGITPDIEDEYIKLVADGLVVRRSGVAAVQHSDGILRKITPNADKIHSLMLLETLKDLFSLQALEALERIESIERMSDLRGRSKISCPVEITTSQGDYRALTEKIKAGDVCYLDPPYENTSGYGGGFGRFDSESFWDWVRSLPCIAVVSSYKAPDDFITLAEFEHRCTIKDITNDLVIEKCFLYKGQEEEYRKRTGWAGIIRDKNGQAELF